jgi:hypothetical protein
VPPAFTFLLGDQHGITALRLRWLANAPTGINGGDDRSCLRTHLRRSFENIVVPHIEAAFNDPRGLTRNGADVEDVAQEAVVRAFRLTNS